MKNLFLVAGAGAVTRRRAGGDHADGQPKAVYFWSVKYRYSLSDGLQQAPQRIGHYGRHVAADVHPLHVFFASRRPCTSTRPLKLFSAWDSFWRKSHIWVMLLLNYLQTVWPLKRGIVPLPDDMSKWPTVDIYIPSYNEPLEVDARYRPGGTMH